MNGIELELAIDELMADASLVELCELLRTGDEVLDVIALSENQHSDILAWMLDAREGHGQGDEILRDLLTCASMQVLSGTSGLDGRGTTARFFAEWPPSRIRTTSFGAAFTARELGMNASERVDLFVIDAQNKFILLIENKSGATHNENQLDHYRESFSKAVATNSRLREYHQVYIALDRKFDGEDSSSRPSAHAWLHLNYDWLKTSAKRALTHVGRGNAAARLVVSYCNRQTDWESPNADICIKLASNLHQTHSHAIKHLINFSRGRLEREWLNNKKDADSLLFLLQNKSAFTLLKETQGMASVKSAILAKMPSLLSTSIQHKRTWLDICPTGWEQFKGDDWWPVFLNIRYSDTSESKYSLALCWRLRNGRTPMEAEDLRRRLAKVEPRFNTYNESRWRYVELESAVTLPGLLQRITELDTKLAKAVTV